MEDKILAYTAGLLDGEGHFGIGRSEKDGLYKFSTRVLIGMNHEPTIRWLQSQFGGTISWRAETDRRDKSFLWSAGPPHKLVMFIPTVLPFLKTKRAHATLLLDFLQQFRALSSTAANISRYAQMNKYYEVMKALNADGPNVGALKEELAKVIKISDST